MVVGIAAPALHVAARRHANDVQRLSASSDDSLGCLQRVGRLKVGEHRIPRTAGQHYEYTLKQLKAFKERQRTNDAGNMTAVVRTISDEDLAAMAAYLSTLR